MKRSALPFPSRPANNRRVSVDSTHSRKSSVYSIRSNREERPRLPSGLTSTLLPSNRLSLASFVSSELSPGESPGRAPSLSFPGRPTGYFDFAERRKRLATFLDETAEAMEGGKSLTMVLPDGSHRPLSQYVEPVSPTDETHPLPLDSQRRTDPRQSIYFTPRVDNHSPSLSEEGRSRFDNLEGSTGLGFNDHQVANRGSSAVEASPTTLRGSSPPRSPKAWDCQISVTSAPEAVPELTETERKAAVAKEEKVAEKRRRTIKELVDTERAYAVDMAVVRDIYLARARGARKHCPFSSRHGCRRELIHPFSMADMTQIADYVMSTGLGLGAFEDQSAESPSSPTSATFAKSASASTSKTPRRSVSGSMSVASSVQPNLMPGQPLMSTKDIHVIFANLEEIAALAETFAEMLAEATGDEEAGSHDRVGATFLEMVSIPLFSRSLSTKADFPNP